MEKNSMHYDTQKTKISKEFYRPSTNMFKFIKSLWAVIIIGHSPIGKRNISKRRP